MRRILQQLSLVSVLLAGNAVADEPSSGALTVRLQALQSAKGKAGCWLFDAAHAKAYPTEPEVARALRWGSIAGSGSLISFEGLAPGTYALACFHDENGNGKLDTNWLGIPNEGMVASNHAKGRMGPPKFEDAKFAFTGPALELVLKVKY